MDKILALISGICWTIVYIECIRIGFKQKTYGIPFFALLLNISWEFLYSTDGLIKNTADIQSWINFVWFLLDAVIVITYLRYGRKDFPQYLNSRFFMPGVILSFIMCLLVQYAFYVEFGVMSAGYAAFIQNLIMSVLFINMLLQRKGTRGQNLVIALCKWIGTLAPTILFGIIHYNFLILVLGGFCSILDIIYIYVCVVLR